jgi:endonuclease/exonuclease/phosphatase family metal-dependent hydrolase
LCTVKASARLAGSLLCALTLTALALAPADAAPARLRVATYKIHAGAGEDGRYDLDPPAAGAPRQQDGVAILSRLPLLDKENHEIARLSTRTADPVAAPAPGFAEVVVGVRGVFAHVYCTHLDYRPDPTVRARQVRDMLGILGHDRGPKILLGDFNADAGAPELSPLWTRLRDAAPGGPATYPAGAPLSRIDLVTVSSGVRVVATRTGETLASDHRPVVADVVLR